MLQCFNQSSHNDVGLSQNTEVDIQKAVTRITLGDISMVATTSKEPVGPRVE